MKKFIKKIFSKLVFLLIFCVVVFAVYKGVIRGIDYVYKSAYPIKYSEYVEKYASEYGVDPYLIYAIIKTESSFKEDSTSNKDARGLMQVMPSTAKEVAGKLKLKNYKEENLLNPEQNIMMGTWYIKYLMKNFDGNLELAIISYNAGMGKTKEWLKNSEYTKDGRIVNIPFDETKNYLKKVLKSYNMYKKIYIPE